MSVLLFAFVLVLDLTCIATGQPRIPPHEEIARVARFVVNQCEWASMATISTHDPVKGQPFSNVFSISDGPVSYGTGIPYMYLTRMEISVKDLEVGIASEYMLSFVVT